MFRLSLIVALSLVSFTSVATRQMPDILMVEGQKIEIIESPLDANMIREITIGMDVWTCSANWRGYRAYWRIVDSQLFLDRVETDPCGDSVLVEPGKICSACEYPIAAYWVDGAITYPTGRRWDETDATEDGDSVRKGYRYEVGAFEVAAGLVLRKYREVRTITWEG
ncbi:MAG: hypothetical protein AB8G16_19725 [Gammaproteobacteria bacterium]